MLFTLLIVFFSLARRALWCTMIGDAPLAPQARQSCETNRRVGPSTCGEVKLLDVPQTRVARHVLAHWQGGYVFHAVSSSWFGLGCCGRTLLCRSLLVGLVLLRGVPGSDVSRSRLHRRLSVDQRRRLLRTTFLAPPLHRRNHFRGFDLPPLATKMPPSHGSEGVADSRGDVAGARLAMQCMRSRGRDRSANGKLDQARNEIIKVVWISELIRASRGVVVVDLWLA